MYISLNSLEIWILFFQVLQIHKDKLLATSMEHILPILRHFHDVSYNPESQDNEVTTLIS